MHRAHNLTDLIIHATHYYSVPRSSYSACGTLLDGTARLKASTQPHEENLRFAWRAKATSLENPSDRAASCCSFAAATLHPTISIENTPTAGFSATKSPTMSSKAASSSSESSLAACIAPNRDSSSCSCSAGNLCNARTYANTSRSVDRKKSECSNRQCGYQRRCDVQSCLSVAGCGLWLVAVLAYASLGASFASSSCSSRFLSSCSAFISAFHSRRISFNSAVNSGTSSDDPPLLLLTICCCVCIGTGC